MKVEYVDFVACFPWENQNRRYSCNIFVTWYNKILFSFVTTEGTYESEVLRLCCVLSWQGSEEQRNTCNLYLWIGFLLLILSLVPFSYVKPILLVVAVQHIYNNMVQRLPPTPKVIFPLMAWIVHCIILYTGLCCSDGVFLTQTTKFLRQVISSFFQMILNIKKC